MGAEEESKKKREQSGFRLNAIADPAMLVGIVGLLVVVVLLFNESIDATWGFTFGLFFAILLLSSLFSMSPEILRHVKEKDRKGL